MFRLVSNQLLHDLQEWVYQLVEQHDQSSRPVLNRLVHFCTCMFKEVLSSRLSEALVEACRAFD